MDMDITVCPNCNNELKPGHKFCSSCGQKAGFHRFTVGHVAHEFFHGFTHADTGIFKLVRSLAASPGRVASEYAEGKIKKYFPPVTFMLICVAFFVLVNNTIKTYPDPPKPDPKVLAVLPTAKAKQNYINLIERTANGSVAINKNANIITLVAIPFYAFIVWLFFRKRGRNYGEIMIAMVFFTAFSTLVSTIVFNPMMAYYKGTTTYFYIFFVTAVLQSFYYTWGLKYFFKYRSATGYLKVWPVMILTSVLWMIVSMLVFFYYVYRENTGKVIAALWKALT